MIKKLLIPVVTTAVLTFLNPAQAADVTVSGDILSSYVWRGIEVNSDAVLQPAIDVAGLTIAGLPLGINIWGSLDLGDNDGMLESGEFSEVDFNLTLGLPMGLDLGLIEYWFPGGSTSVREISLSLGFDVLLAPELTVYFDVSDDPEDAVSADYYANLGLTLWAGDVAGCATAVAAGIGYAGEDHAILYGGGTDAGFFDAAVSVSGSKAISDAAAVGFLLTYTANVDDDALSDANSDTDVYGGVTGRVSF